MSQSAEMESVATTVPPTLPRVLEVVYSQKFAPGSGWWHHAYEIPDGRLPAATVMPELEGWRMAAYYGLAREVGGDFYDFLEFSDGRFGLVVGDATGHARGAGDGNDPRHA